MKADTVSALGCFRRVRDHPATLGCNAGLARARADGKRLGRPQVEPAVTERVREELSRGTGMLKTAKLVGVGVAFGALSMTIKDGMRGISPEDRWSPKNAQQAIGLGATLLDRSLAMGYMSPYGDAALKITGLSGSARYQRNDALTSLLGINASLLGDVNRFGTSVFAGDKGKDVLKKALVLAPFSNLLRLFHGLYFDDMRHAKAYP
jgi:hypothetical protein